MTHEPVCVKRNSAWSVCKSFDGYIKLMKKNAVLRTNLNYPSCISRTVGNRLVEMREKGVVDLHIHVFLDLVNFIPMGSSATV